MSARVRCPTCRQLMAADRSKRSARAKGGLKLLEERGPEYFRELGKRGGRPRLPRHTDKEKASQPGVSVVEKNSAKEAPIS